MLPICTSFSTRFYLILLLIFILNAHARIYRSLNIGVDCEATFQPTIHESYLLSEGDGLILDCNVCSQCFKVIAICGPGEIHSEWSIQRLGLDSRQREVRRYIEPYNVTGDNIRIRLRKRMWQNVSTLTDILPLLYGDFQFKTENFTEADSVVHEPLSLYFTIAKPGQPLDIIKTESKKLVGRTRAYLYQDVFRIKRAKTDDTGIYRCIFKRREIRVWSITVMKPGGEPFRNIFLPRKVITEDYKAKLLDEEIMGNSALQPLPIQYLVKNNLKLFTNWYPWSECIPCTPKDQLNSSREPAKDGFQIRIGICYVTPIDRSRAVKPGMLATETGETLKLYTKPGLTCRSHLIKDSVLKYGPIEIQKRPSEIKIRQCVQTCPDIGFSDAASSTESSTPVLSGLPRFPKRITIRVNEGEPLVITCPVRNSAEKPITWFYAPENYEELMQLTKTAYNLTTVGQYGSPTQYLAAKLKQVDFPTLIRQTRGRYKIDSAYNIIVAEAMLIKEERYRGLHHLICVHGDARAVHIKNNNDNNSSNHSKGYIYGEWSGIIHIDTIPRNTFVVFLSKLTPVIQLLIPFILALGIFFIVILTLHTERKPEMRLAASGMTTK